MITRGVRDSVVLAVAIVALKFVTSNVRPKAHALKLSVLNLIDVYL